MRSRATADEWALVLNASGIDCRIEQRDGGLTLSVDGADAERATAALSAYTRERRRAPVAIEVSSPRRDGLIAGLVTAISLPLFHVVTTVWLPSRPWMDHGSGAATHI